MSLVSFFAYQVLAVNKSSVLRTAMSEQLLAKYEDKTLPYSQQGEFNFCNVDTWAATDKDAIKSYAQNKTQAEGGNTTLVTNMTTE